MRLRTFLAPSMTNAIEQVRAALGADAIIVSSLENSNGSVEVTAAVQATSSLVEQSTVLASDAKSIEEELESMLRKRLRLRTRSASASTRDITIQGIAPANIPFDAAAISAALENHAVPADLRDDLVTASLAFHKDDAVTALAAALETRFRFDPLPLRPETPVMAVGLPGSGKTATLAKLAARSIVDGATVDIITTDTSRTGAVAQGEAYGQLLGTNLRRAETIDVLALLLEERAGPAARPCFIDTASVNPFDQSEFSSLRHFMDEARNKAGVEPLLVMSSMGDAGMLGEIAAEFARSGIRRMIATQLDITRRIGPVLAAADASGLALAQISVTPYLARGLAQMTPYVCARLILGDRTNNAAPAPEHRKTGISS